MFKSILNSFGKYATLGVALWAYILLTRWVLTRPLFKEKLNAWADSLNPHIQASAEILMVFAIIAVLLVPIVFVFIIFFRLRLREATEEERLEWANKINPPRNPNHRYTLTNNWAAWGQNSIKKHTEA